MKKNNFKSNLEAATPQHDKAQSATSDHASNSSTTFANQMNALQPMFSIDKVYTKDVSLEIPHAPQIFLNREQPSIDLSLDTTHEQLDAGVFQTTLLATISAKIGTQQMFLIEVQQAGIFQMHNIEASQMELLQNIECPNILFPYLRETVSQLTTRAGFIPVILTPVNFAYLYQQKKQADLAKANATIN